MAERPVAHCSCSGLVLVEVPIIHWWNTFTGGILSPGKGEGILSPGRFMDIRTYPVDCPSPIELLAVTQDSTKSWVAHNPKLLTCLTIHASITSNTFACVLMNAICTSTTIVTGDTKTFIYIC